jgi:hypothetical protein
MRAQAILTENHPVTNVPAVIPAITGMAAHEVQVLSARVAAWKPARSETGIYALTPLHNVPKA